MTESLVGLHVFTDNWKVSAIGGGFGKIDAYQKVTKSALLKSSQNFVARVTELCYFLNLKNFIISNLYSFYRMKTCNLYCANTTKKYIAKCQRILLKSLCLYLEKLCENLVLTNFIRSLLKSKQIVLEATNFNL